MFNVSHHTEDDITDAVARLQQSGCDIKDIVIISIDKSTDQPTRDVIHTALETLESTTDHKRILVCDSTYPTAKLRKELVELATFDVMPVQSISIHPKTNRLWYQRFKGSKVY